MEPKHKRIKLTKEEEAGEASSSVAANNKEDLPLASNSLWVAGIPKTLTGNELKELFKLCGKVNESKILEMGRLHYGFIRMASAEEEVLCIEKLNCSQFQNNIITVEPTPDKLKVPIEKGIRRYQKRSAKLSANFVVNRLQDISMPSTSSQVSEGVMKVHINDLPDEMLAYIFQFFCIHERGILAQVCKLWHRVTKRSELWMKIDVKIHLGDSEQLQTKMAYLLSDKVPNCAKYMKLELLARCSMCRSLRFDQFSQSLGLKYSFLKALFLHLATFSVSLRSAIDLCRQFLRNLEIISFRGSNFDNTDVEVDYQGVCKLKVVDLSYNNIGSSSHFCLSKMPNLKKLFLIKSGLSDDLWPQNDSFFLENLQVLSLRTSSSIRTNIFPRFKLSAAKLTELYLCKTRTLQSSDFGFERCFPHLKTVCFFRCKGLTQDIIVSLILSCKSLEIVYVDAKFYLIHLEDLESSPQLSDPISKVIKVTDKCFHETYPYSLNDYLRYFTQ